MIWWKSDNNIQNLGKYEVGIYLHKHPAQVQIMFSIPSGILKISESIPGVYWISIFFNVESYIIGRFSLKSNWQGDRNNNF